MKILIIIFLLLPIMAQADEYKGFIEEGGGLILIVLVSVATLGVIGLILWSIKIPSINKKSNPSKPQLMGSERSIDNAKF